MGEVGFAAGYLPLPDRLRVREFLHMFGQLYGVRDLRARIGTALDRFDIGHLAGRLGTELSSGQRTLVGVVKATLHRPRLLVLDEPTASLDPDMARRVRAGLAELCDGEGTALLLTSHNMAEVEHLCQRVVFLAGGRVVADDRPASVASRFGRRDLEDVFLHLADQRPAGVQQTDRSA
jgi:ABC-2 type transport system ATP-binding protein